MRTDARWIVLVLFIIALCADPSLALQGAAYTLFGVLLGVTSWLLWWMLVNR